MSKLFEYGKTTLNPDLIAAVTVDDTRLTIYLSGDEGAMFADYDTVQGALQAKARFVQKWNAARTGVAENV